MLTESSRSRKLSRLSLYIISVWRGRHTVTSDGAWWEEREENPKSCSMSVRFSWVLALELWADAYKSISICICRGSLTLTSIARAPGTKNAWNTPASTYRLWLGKVVVVRHGEPR